MNLSVVPVTVEQLEAFQLDPAEFGALIGSAVPAGWPEFPEAVEFTVDKLRSAPAEADWWMQLFLDDGQLVGSGGFVGPPDDGVVEIGYEIAPEYRGRGYATAAARAMVDRAFATAVHTVVAHTMPAENPSTGVLRKLGFRHTGQARDPDAGTVWGWALTAP